MPTYIYECFEEDGGCGTQYEQKLSVSDLDSYKPKCPTCKKRKCVKRNLVAELSEVYFTQSQPQTLGALAERNTTRLSNDERSHIKYETNKYKDAPLDHNSLPEGASFYPVDAQGKRIPSKQQSTDNKRKLPPKQKRTIAPKKKT